MPLLNIEFWYMQCVFSLASVIFSNLDPKKNSCRLVHLFLLLSMPKSLSVFLCFRDSHVLFPYRFPFRYSLFFFSVDLHYVFADCNSMHLIILLIMGTNSIFRRFLTFMVQINQTKYIFCTMYAV